MPVQNKYDYIIAGAGCAGLSLLMHLIESGKFTDKKILLIDKEEKIRNDRTWCFWETKPSLFESIVYSRWNRAGVYSDEHSIMLELDPYTYKLIRGVDFYQYCFEKIKKEPNVDIHYSSIGNIRNENDLASMTIGERKINAQYIFNSIPFEKPAARKGGYDLVQHFKGWIIETEHAVFKPAEATLMDFRVSQSNGSCFVYVMPLSVNRALVEYTLFSEKLLDDEVYVNGLKEYIEKILIAGPYIITEEENGQIPMTNYPFKKFDGNIINIGTAGGLTKPSTGYTFKFIQKHSVAITKLLIENKLPVVPSPSSRFRFYDSTLLHILYNKQVEGKKIFTELFRKNEPARVLRFLDNESNLADELKIISSLPTMPFLKAALKQI